jgi:hypothetical protein
MVAMSEYRIRAFDLVNESLDRDDGEGRIAVCEEAVRQADLSGDLKTQYFAREHFVRACAFGGAPDRALLSFSWLVAQFDKNRDNFSEWSILWKYKWIVGLIANFPQIPKTRIYEMLDDFETRAVRAGYGLHSVYMLRYRLEKFWGNKKQAIEFFQKMSELPVDDLSNCEVCEVNERFVFAIYRGDDERGVELAISLFEGGKKCATVPQRTYADVLLPLVRLGRQPEALAYHRRGYPMIRHNINFMDEVADHLIFLVLTENLDRAVTLFGRHFPWLEQGRDLYDHFRFLLAGWLLFDVRSAQTDERVQLRLGKFFPHFSEDNYYDPNVLAIWCKEKAGELATRFDERNETDFFSQTLAETPALKKLCAPFPLKNSPA